MWRQHAIVLGRLLDPNLRPVDDLSPCGARLASDEQRPAQCCGIVSIDTATT